MPQGNTGGHLEHQREQQSVLVDRHVCHIVDQCHELVEDVSTRRDDFLMKHHMLVRTLWQDAVPIENRLVAWHLMFLW